MITALNQNSLTDERVTVYHQDAWTWLAIAGDLYDLVIIDLPDPESEDVAKLYSIAFYQRVAGRLSVGGVMITQATSPWFACRAFWSIGGTLEAVFMSVKPATVYIPSFGLWGFFIGANHTLESPVRSSAEGRFMNDQTLLDVLRLPADLPKLDVAVNRNHALALIEYYREGWESLNLATMPAAKPKEESRDTAEH